MSNESIDYYGNVALKTEEKIAINMETNDSFWYMPLSEGAKVVQFDERETDLIKAGTSNMLVELRDIKKESHGLNDNVNVEPYARLKCDSVFININDLSKHTRTHSEADITKVTKSNSVYTCTEKETLKLHLVSAHSETKKSMNFAGTRKAVDFKDSSQKISLDKLMPVERGNIVEFYKDDVKPEPNDANRIEGGPSGSVHIGEDSGSDVDVKSHVCTYCERVFKHTSAVHLKLKTFVCGKCEHTFSQQVSLNQHSDSVNSKLKKFLCGECGRAFSQQGALKIHVDSVHRKLKKFTCAGCDRAFSQRGSLKMHFDLIHSELKKFVCRECDRAFSGPGHLKRHLDAVHRKLKKFSCGECDRAFTNRQHLKSHLDAIHRKIKKYCCEKCDRPFSTKYSLKMHYVTHSKLANYLCSECNRAFRYRSSLIAHFKSTHSTLS